MVEFTRDPKSDCAIAGRVQFIRKVLGFNREEFARAVRISKDQLYNYENLRSVIPCGIVLRICRTFFVDEKWFAGWEENSHRPGVDLMSHSVYLDIDPSAPYSNEFPALEAAYNELAQLPFFEMVDRHVESCGSDVFRLQLFGDFIFKFYAHNEIKDPFFAELLGYALKNVQQYLEYNGVEYDFSKGGMISGGSYRGIPEQSKFGD